MIKNKLKRVLAVALAGMMVAGVAGCSSSKDEMCIRDSGCTIGHNTVIGMGAIVMNGAKIGSDCIIGAGSLVTQGTVIPDGMLAFGSPAKDVYKRQAQRLVRLRFHREEICECRVMQVQQSG